MRRKNMLALGLSAVLCTGLFETASAVEGLEDFQEETAVEGKTASIEEEVPTTDAEDSA